MRKTLTLKKLVLYVCMCLIALSGCHTQLEKGFDDYLKKPLEYDRLNEMLSELYSLQR